MNNNRINIPISNSNIIPKYKRNNNNPLINKTLNKHISFDAQTNTYVKNEYITLNNSKKKTKKILNTNEGQLLKRSYLNHIPKSRDIHKEYNEINSYKINFDSEPKKEILNTRADLNDPKFFNENGYKLILKKNYNNNDSNNNIDKNRDNYSYYESKYSKKTIKDKDNINNFINNKNNEKNLNLYSNENKNTLNIINNNSKNNIMIESKITNNNNELKKNLNKKIITEPYSNKFQNEKIRTLVNTSDYNNKKRLFILKNRNIASSNKKINTDFKINKIPINNNNLPPRQILVNLDKLKNNYHSPERQKKEERGLIFHNNSYVNKNKFSKNTPSKSIDKISNKRIDLTQKKENNRNIPIYKKIEIIKEYKSNMIEVKKPLNLGFKRIPISPNEKNVNRLNNINQNLISINQNEENINKMKSIHSYTTSKLLENQTLLSNKSQNNENFDRKSSIKGINLLETNKSKKSISNDIENEIIKKSKERYRTINNINRNKFYTIKVNSSKCLFDDDNKKKTNETNDNDQTKFNYNKYREIVEQKNKLKKEKSVTINNDISERRMNSHKKLDINKQIKNGNSSCENTILLKNKNKIIERKIQFNSIYNNDFIPNNNYSYNQFSKKNNSHTNVPIVNTILFSKYNGNNNYNFKNPTEISNKSNRIETIQISRINPSPLEKNQYPSYLSNYNSSIRTITSSIPTQKQKRYLSEFPKYESRAYTQIYNENNKNKEKNNNIEDEWNNAEYMGLRKRTYEPRLRRKKNKNKNLKNLIRNTFLNNEFSENRYIKSCESISVPGKKENGNKKTNQDSYIIERNINGILNFNIFGVLDGHGEYGHYASQFVSRYVINHIKNHPLIKKCDDPKEIYQKLILNGYRLIANIFIDADIQIQKEKFDCQNSGTTCIIVIQLEEKIICANTGDSRAILIYNKNNDDNLMNSKIYNLSYDCKPELPKERQRIYECGGCVEKALDENDEEGGPYRVWVQGEDYPGLAMSRSIGDMDAKKIGVIPNPQIVEYTIDYYSKYMMIASDGIWEFISNEEAMKIGNKFYSRNDAIGLCNELYKKSLNLWLKEDCVVDDMTLIVVFF